MNKSYNSYPNTMRGATLLEMLLVMGIIALIAAMVVPSLSLPSRPPVPPLIAFLQQQQQAAVTDGKTRRIVWKEPQILSYPDKQAFDLPKDFTLSVQRPERTGFLDEQLLAVFYSDGTGIAAQFSVLQKKLASPGILLYKVEINPFHSEISYAYP